MATKSFNVTNTATEAYLTKSVKYITEDKSELSEAQFDEEARKRGYVKEKESRSRHIQILAKKSLFDRIKERITADHLSMNDAFEQAMTMWLDYMEQREYEDL